MADSALLNNSFVIQNLLQQAEELTNQSFGSNSTLTIVGEEQYSTSNGNKSPDLNGLKIEEVNGTKANQILRSSPTTNVNPQYQLINGNSAANVAVNRSTSVSRTTTTLNYSGGELFQDPNPPQLLRRPAVQGPLKYRQNVSVRFLKPTPLPPPGPLIIKEVRPPQPPAPRPLVVRQYAAPLPTPPPLILREQPPRTPAPIPPQVIIKRLPPIPVPPRSIIIERYPPKPPRPRDVIIERWLPYSKEPQRRKVITYKAPPPPPYPPPRNTIITYEPIQANVVRSVQKFGIQTQNPEDYLLQYGNTLLDASTLVAQAQNAGVIEDLSPLLNGVNQQYQTTTTTSEYYLNTTQTVWEPEYEYSTTAWENQTTNNNEKVEVYYTDPYEDVRVTLQRLGLESE